MSQDLLNVRGLHVEVDGKPILRGVDLDVRAGEIHCLMGRNGSGKSTLSNVLLGHPAYQVTAGTIHFLGEDLLALATDERARRGIFLAFQYPLAIPGVTVANFLRQAVKARHATLGRTDLSARDFRKQLTEQMAALEMDASFATRYVNDGFSGGEKKRLEILQLAMLEPRLAILDETDSGLDIDALRIVAQGIQRHCTPTNGVLMVTHYERLLKLIRPNFVHILMQGRIVRSGGPELAEEVDAKGFEWIADTLDAQGVAR